MELEDPGSGRRDNSNPEALKVRAKYQEDDSGEVSV